MKKFWLTIILTLTITSCYMAEASFVTKASYYTVESCLLESGQYQMANGRMLNDKEFTCASWDYPFGTRLEITNTQTHRKVISVVTDRGPAKSLYRKGRKIDLSKASFEAIADLKDGIIEVEIRKIK